MDSTACFHFTGVQVLQGMSVIQSVQSLHACTNNGYPSILNVFLWPGNEASTAIATAVDKTHPSYFLLFPPSEKNSFTNSYSQQQVILEPWKNDIVIVLV